MLFGEDVAPIKEKKAEVSVNFGSLAREEEKPISNSQKIIEDERRSQSPTYNQPSSTIDYNYQESDASIIRNERMSGAYEKPAVEEKQREPIQDNIVKINVEEKKEPEDNALFDLEEDSAVYEMSEDEDSSVELTKEEEIVSNSIVEEKIDNEEQELEAAQESEEVEDLQAEDGVDEISDSSENEDNIQEETSEEVVEEQVNINADEDEEEIEEEDYDDSEESIIVEEKPVYKPSTVVEEKPVTSTSEILRSEKESQEPLVVDREQVRENMNANRPITNVASDDNVDKFATYDVRAIEKVLHESRTESAKNDSARIKRTWKVLESNNLPDFAGITNVLKQGNVVVVGNREFIITFANSTICNQAMKPDFKRSASKLFTMYFGDTYNYIALPERIWAEKRSEYVSQYNIGIKYPTLTPINDSSLVIIKPDQEYKDPNEKVLDDARNKFGKFIRIE